MPFSPDLVEEHLGGFQAEPVGEDLAVVGQDLLGHPVAFQRSPEVAAHGPGRGPDHDAGADAEPGVVVHPGQDLALGAVLQEHTADHVHLPELHGAAPLPAFVGREALALGLGLDLAVPDQGPIDGHVGRDLSCPLALQLMGQTDRSPARVLATHLEDAGLDGRGHLMGARFRPV
jgi:hypothetical protein